MLINLRNALMGGKRLPYDAEVEFLQSSGTQYVNTGVDAAVGLSVDTTFAYTAQTTYGILFGVQSPTRNFMEVRLNANTATLTALVRNAVTTMGAVTFNNVNRFVGKWTSTGADLDLNGTTYTSTAGAVVGSANYPLYIFAGNQDNAAAYHSKARVYSFKITNANGTLVRDFIPVRKGTVGYLYDRVSGKLFGNAGTGDFVLGQDVVPVEWLQTDGAAYIDTGLEMADGHEVRAEHYFKRSTTRQLMGSNASRQYYGVSADGYVEFGLLGTNKSTVSVDESKKYLISYAASAGNNTGAVYDGDTLLWSGSGAYYGFSNSFKIFRLSTNASLAFANGNKIVSFRHIANGTVIQDLIPVRIGTEGAMMDTLTRRIYRNAGSGAFTYGNDLKYPIPAE